MKNWAVPVYYWENKYCVVGTRNHKQPEWNWVWQQQQQQQNQTGKWGVGFPPSPPARPFWRRYIYVVVQLRILAALLELLSYPLEGLEEKWQKREETTIVSAALIFYFWIICLSRITQKFVVLQWVAKVSERTITFIKFSVKTFIYLLFSHISILRSVYKMLTNFKQLHSRKG